MIQDKKYIKSRDRLKEYFSFRKYLGNSSANIKSSGGIYNGERNGDLNADEVVRIKDMLKEIKEAVKAIDDFEKEFNRANGN